MKIIKPNTSISETLVSNLERIHKVIIDLDERGIESNSIIGLINATCGALSRSYYPLTMSVSKDLNTKDKQ